MKHGLSVKAVVVGDRCSGKTELIRIFAGTSFLDGLVPVFDNACCDMMVDDKCVKIQVWEAGDDFEARLLSYPKADVLIVAFSLGSREEVERVKCKWMNEIREAVPGVPFILVGIGSDIGDGVQDPGGGGSGRGDGELLKAECGAAAYVECSITVGRSVGKVFEMAIRTALRLPSQKVVRSHFPGPVSNCRKKIHPVSVGYADA
jgi:GTPase SAR1 family protein